MRFGARVPFVVVDSAEDSRDPTHNFKSTLFFGFWLNHLDSSFHLSLRFPFGLLLAVEYALVEVLDVHVGQIAETLSR